MHQKDTVICKNHWELDLLTSGRNELSKFIGKRGVKENRVMKGRIHTIRGKTYKTKLLAISAP